MAWLFILMLRSEIDGTPSRHSKTRRCGQPHRRRLFPPPDCDRSILRYRLLLSVDLTKHCCLVGHLSGGAHVRAGPCAQSPQRSGSLLHASRGAKLCCSEMTASRLIWLMCAHVVQEKAQVDLHAFLAWGVTEEQARRLVPFLICLHRLCGAVGGAFAGEGAGVGQPSATHP